MKVELPTSTVDCEEFTETVIGKFKLIGLRMSGKPRLSMIAIDTKAGSVVGAYKTKMRNIEQISLLFNRIEEDRDNNIYRSFNIYANAWVSKTNYLRVPEVKHSH